MVTLTSEKHSILGLTLGVGGQVRPEFLRKGEEFCHVVSEGKTVRTNHEAAHARRGRAPMNLPVPDAPYQ